MRHRVLTESIELHPIGSCFSDDVGNSELREILREYFVEMKFLILLIIQMRYGVKLCSFLREIANLSKTWNCHQDLCLFMKLM